LDNGYQACMMAPTEILANQHFETIRELLYGMDIRVELLTGSVKGKKRNRGGCGGRKHQRFRRKGEA